MIKRRASVLCVSMPITCHDRGDVRACYCQLPLCQWLMHDHVHATRSRHHLVTALGLVSSSGLPEWVIFSSDFPSSGTCTLQVPTVGFERCSLLSSLLRVTPLPTEHDVMCDGLSQ